MPILKWLLEYVGTMHYLYKVGSDVMTPRERVTGRKVHRTMVPLGQKVNRGNTWAKLR